MYCSTCGSTVSPNLTYCNHCGARLSGAKEAKPENLVAAIAAVFILGVGAIIFLMMAMKMVFGPEYLPLVIAFTLLSFLIMLGVEGVFIGMLLRGKKRAKEATKELSEAKARVLPEQAISVTEHTTNLLETADRNHQT